MLASLASGGTAHGLGKLTIKGSSPVRLSAPWPRGKVALRAVFRPQNGASATFPPPPLPPPKGGETGRATSAARTGLAPVLSKIVTYSYT